MFRRLHHRHRWTPEEDSEMRRLFASGAYTQDVARKLGRSQEAIRTRAEMLGISIRSAPRNRLRQSHA